MEFRVLGTLEVLDNGGNPVELRGSKLRALLAALSLRAGLKAPTAPRRCAGRGARRRLCAGDRSRTDRRGAILRARQTQRAASEHLGLGNTEAVSALFGYLPTPDERELVDSTLAAATADIGEAGVAEAMAAGAQLSYTELPQVFAG